MRDIIRRSFSWEITPLYIMGIGIVVVVGLVVVPGLTSVVFHDPEGTPATIMRLVLFAIFTVVFRPIMRQAFRQAEGRRTAREQGEQ